MTADAKLEQRFALEQEARSTARQHGPPGRQRPSRTILERVSLLPAWLGTVEKYCQEPAPAHVHAADWLLDNDYQIRRAIRQAGEDLPPKFYRRLSVAESEDSDGFPRVYALSHALLDATRMQLSSGSITRYLNAYQEVTPLSIAELWAFPSILRMACLFMLCEGFYRLNRDLKPPFEADPYLSASRIGDPADMISRSIVNLGVIHSIEWRDIVDRTSTIEKILGTDPAKIYLRMDFQTRDRYRRRVERLAGGSQASESDIALRAIEMSKALSADERRNHVGYWLIGDGREELEESIEFHPTAPDRFRRQIGRHTYIVYAVPLLLTTMAALILPLYELYRVEAGLAEWLAVLLLSLLPVTVLSIAVVHRLITAITSPRVLPMLDFRKGIAKDCPTAVVVPIIVADGHDIPEILEKLEIRRLSNPDPLLRFVLLSDPPDAASEKTGGDIAIENALVSGIRKLNAQHGGDEGGPFFLMHRRRRYNQSENCWMAWERKRGKLEQFNEFVLGGDADEFAVTEGRIETLKGTRFVITLDNDTTLPPESAARMVGALAHPLNRALFDPETGMVVSGYTIIQPRIEILPQKSASTLFCRLLSGDTAIDIYSRAISDVYQDLFGTGIFVGKGIYDVSAFRRSLEGRVPENTILSHDLFEGIHGRAALATNIVLYENYPATYPEYALRLHRWVRGDWQLIPWLARSVPVAGGSRAPNPLSLLDRWKIVDNLRRSLIAPALLMFFISGWWFLPGSALLWTALAAAAPGAYVFAEIFSGLARDIRRRLAGNIIHRLAPSAGRWFLTITFLINDTLISLDAIGRTVWRVFVSRQKLLEWRSAAHVSAGMKNGSSGLSTWKLMWPSSVVSLLLGLDLALFSAKNFLPAFPVLALWFVAPAIAYWLGRPRFARREFLGLEDQRFLRHAARRAWLFFETFAGPGDNWLPPDNYQEDPKNEVAHRTSPTNIGLFLTSSHAAMEFGFIGTRDFCVRGRNTLNSLGRMKSYRGHILNWYDTRSLEPLEPRYVSSVDSGNLAICLLELAHAAGCARALPPVRLQLWDGLSCTFEILIETASKLKGAQKARFNRLANDYARAVGEAKDDPLQWPTLLNNLSGVFWPELELETGKAVAASEPTPPGLLAEVQIWLERFQHHIHAMQRDLDTYLPWLSPGVSPPPSMSGAAKAIGAALSPVAGTDVAGRRAERACEILAAAKEDCAGEEDAGRWLDAMERAIKSGAEAQQALADDLAELGRRAEEIAFGMDFKFLYDPEARLFRIGYNESTGQPDANHYDLLATEARLASFFAIAKHDVPVEHWFFLGRPVTRLRGKPSILSWNGSMFEYLMAPLFLPGRRDTLLGESEATSVEYQRRYARERGVPWGISESAFAVTDADGNYQYRAFGAPGLGMRRGLTEDLVIAPYASALALCCWPKAAVTNLKRLAELGARGIYGYYDAVDFTPGRAPSGEKFIPVRTYMAHHHGMTMGAIANALKDDLLVNSVLADKHMRTVDLLLQERIPWDAPLEKGRVDETWKEEPAGHFVASLPPWVPSSQATAPQYLLTGNGRMAAWMSESGAGRLSLRDEALTRWTPDPTGDGQGYWIYVRDAESGAVWSAGRQPCRREGDDSRVIFRQHMVEMFRRDEQIALRTETTVAPGDDIEIRRITVTNESDRPRELEFTSYGEVVLAPPQDDERHPAFSKLFIESTFLADRDGLLFERRPRRPETRHCALLHRLVADDPAIRLAGYETDRARFVGRGRSMQDPAGVGEQTSRTTGFTLDPIMSLRIRLSLQAMATKSFAFVTIAGTSRANLFEIAERYSWPALSLAFRDADREAAREVARLEIEPARLPELQALGSLLVNFHAALRAPAAGVDLNVSGQPNLWRFGISGDLPILLVRMGMEDSSGLLDFLIRGQHLWRRGGLQVDLVVLRSETAGYEEPLREKILSTLRDTQAYGYLGRKGGIHLVSASGMAADSRRGLESAAHVVLDDDGTPLADKLDRILEQRELPPRFAGTSYPDHAAPAPLEKPEGLLFANGFGGFDAQSGDYLIHLEENETTPAPWCNVLANDHFGTIVSESGLGFTWAVNSGENRITPWSNDPVADPQGEALYLRDEETAEFWTVTPSPAGPRTAFQARHGAGHTSWRRNSHGMEQEMEAFVPADDPVKIVKLRLANPSGKVRRVTVTYYAQWLLGALPSRSRPHVACEYDASCHAILANNAWNPEFAGQVAFLSASSPPHSLTGDSYDFLGHEGSTRNPAALRHWGLGGRFTPGADSCAAYQIHIDIGAGETAEAFFILGQCENRDAAKQMIAKWNDGEHVEKELKNVRESWKRRLGAVAVKTPDPAFDLMINRWLIYQTVASRMMARAGFYQAGGAFGFRDQLQDALGVLQAEPARAKERIIDAARHQFELGDALHWWHPPSGRGVRTRCSDDYIWLVYVTARYVHATGDYSILKEDIPFLTAPPLRANEHDRYAQFDTGASGTLFDHCSNALNRMMATGAHGLPLIGAGDWNDGMDRVGEKGLGESVWLAWFQIATIDLFAPIARKFGVTERPDRWRRHARELIKAVNDNAWDGEWYVRAFDDEGNVWGSHLNEECRIDSIAQSWGVIAGRGGDERVEKAVRSAADQLVLAEDRLVLLLNPPFHATMRDPGYIKAYAPGIRENGGQYTHAAAWLGIGLAGLGDGDGAWRIFDIINPVRRTASRDGALRYRVEPYVLPGDIAGPGQNPGRGGWSWYTGAAGWTWQLGVEAILGIRPTDGAVSIDPCLPKDWGAAEVTVSGSRGTIEISIRDPGHCGKGRISLVVDGKKARGTKVRFPGRSKTRKVVATIASAP